MKKTILTLTLASATLFTTSVFAQSTNNANNCQTAPCAPCGSGYNCNAPCPYFQNPDSCMMNPFADLNLTADQQAKIKELRNKKFQQKTKDIKTKQELRQAKRQDFLNDLKGILSQEQYVQFLENSYTNGPAFGKGYRNYGKYGKNDCNRRHHRGNRYNCQTNDCPVAPCQGNATPAAK